MIDEDRNVLAPLAKRGKLDLDRVQPEQEILSEQALVGKPEIFAGPACFDVPRAAGAISRRSSSKGLDEFVGRLCKPSPRTDGLGNPSYNY